MARRVGAASTRDGGTSNAVRVGRRVGDGAAELVGAPGSHIPLSWETPFVNAAKKG
jgi:hypothetical protein